MAGLLERPSPPLTHQDGLLRKDQFQVSYVTNDLDRACAILRDRYGIRDFQYLEGPMPAGGHIRVAFAWVGATMYEIIAATGAEAEFYNRRLPTDRFAVRFHHLGFLVHDREAWRALEAEFRAKNWPIVYQTQIPGFMDAYYVEAPELDHYLEYIFPEPGGIEFFRSVPVS